MTDKSTVIISRFVDAPAIFMKSLCYADVSIVTRAKRRFPTW